MVSRDEVRDKMNMYIYMLNKYNIYGVGAVLFAAWYLGILMFANQITVSGITKLLALVLILCFSIKMLLLKFFDFHDVCECKLDEFDYYHPKRNTCPKEQSISSVVRDFRYVVEELVINIGFRYNFGALIAIFIFAPLLGLFTINRALFNLFNFIGLGLLMVIFKMAVNYFFVIQEFCPCSCYYQAPKIDPSATKLPKEKHLKKEVNRDIQDMKEDKIQKDDLVGIIKQEVDNIVSSDTIDRSDAIADRIDKEIETEIKNLLPITNKSPFDKRLKDLCKVASETLKRYDTVDSCLEEVRKSPEIKKQVKAMLMDDKTYSCLQDYSSETQFDQCFRDYFSRHPHFLIRLVNAMPDSVSQSK